jgi:antibiotic biosynthesis monooxygenase (ABM) superfamily enzyme
MDIVTEIVTMRTMAGIGKERCICVVDGLEKNFHSKLPGFIDSELLRDEKNDEWIMIQHWDGLDNLRSASKKMFNNPVTESFVQAVDPKAVKMIILPQVGAWKC